MLIVLFIVLIISFEFIFYLLF